MILCEWRWSSAKMISILANVRAFKGWCEANNVHDLFGLARNKGRNKLGCAVATEVGRDARCAGRARRAFRLQCSTVHSLASCVILTHERTHSLHNYIIQR
jgi:hypothetical protein